MELNMRRMLTIVDDKFEEAGRKAGTRLRKVAVVAILENPYVGRYVSDLRPLIEASESLGSKMARESVSALGEYAAESYGKGGIVGLDGEQEHANALLTTVFAAPFREAIGGAKAWISSMTKVAAPGTLIDVPMNSKDDVYVRSHYDGMSIMLPDAPKPGEIAIIFCVANRGRLNARLGGLSIEKARGQAAQV
jgi:Amino acid synthesis